MIALRYSDFSEIRHEKSVFSPSLRHINRWHTIQHREYSANGVVLALGSRLGEEKENKERERKRKGIREWYTGWIRQMKHYTTQD